MTEQVRQPGDLQLEDLIGDVPIEDILDNRLMPAPFEDGITKKYLVNGLPGSM